MMKAVLYGIVRTAFKGTRSAIDHRGAGSQ